jgi:hypothetical protein
VSTVAIQTVAGDDQARVIATLVSALIADPVERWLYPEPVAYLTQFPAFVAAFGGAAFDRQTVWSLEEFAALTMWLAPGSEVDGEAIVAVLATSVCLVGVDADRSPAFLQTPNPRTVAFDERHGFRVTSVARAGACPPVTSMLRPAQ